MLRLIAVTIVLGIPFGLPTVSHSQSEPLKVFLGPHLGIQKSPDADDANYLVGATLRLRLLPVLGAEGDIGYRQEKYGSDVVTVRNWPVTVTGLLYPLPILYGGLGAGWYNTTFDYAESFNQAGYDDETTGEFGWHLAAGVELAASQKVSLFGDVRYVFLDYDFKELPEAVLGGVDSDFYSINFGLLFRL